MMLLTDTDSLEYVVKDGLRLTVIPTPNLRPIVEWAMVYYRTTGVAPTPEILNEHFTDILSDHDIDPAGDVDETIEWALSDLKGSFVRNETGGFARRMISEMTEVGNDERVDVLAKYATELSSLAMSVQSSTTQIDLRDAGADILADYAAAVATRGQVMGMGFGLPVIDAYTRGIHEGELAIMAGGPKTGKSMFLNWTAYQEWQRGRVVALFTLENSIQMTQMRIACMACQIDGTRLADGTLEDEDYEQLETWVNENLAKSDVPLLIFSPDDHLRTPQALVQAARAHGADSLILDQLSFMDNAKAHNAKARRDDIMEITKDLRVLISTGRKRLPCLLAHQINREGVKVAEKTGHLSMYHMADSTDVERICDWAFGLYASEMAREMGRMQWQTLASRRGPVQNFDLVWAPERGVVNVAYEVDLT